MSLNGASSVLLADISAAAVENTKRNIDLLEVQNAQALQSNLFENLSGKGPFDVIVFNHPFFSGEPEELVQHDSSLVDLPRTMLGGTDLLPTFYKQVVPFLSTDGIIVTTYFHFAGHENDPSHVAEKHGFRVKTVLPSESTQGLQQGAMSVYITEAAE